MPQVFPITANTPAPNWVSDLVWPDVPIIERVMSNGMQSRLRLTSIPSGAEMSIMWAPVTYIRVQALLDFFNLVGRWDSFTLPAGFWVSVPASRVTQYTGASPSGNWRLKEFPKLTEIEFTRGTHMVNALFQGVID